MIKWTITQTNDGNVTLECPGGLYRTTNDVLVNMSLQAADYRMREVWDGDHEYWFATRKSIPSAMRPIVIRIMACDTLDTLTPDETRAYSQNVAG